MAAHNVASFPVEPHTAFIICTLYNFCKHCVRPTEAYWWKPVIQFSRCATVDTTNVLSSYFMTVDMHRDAFKWLVYSRSTFFRDFRNNLGEPILGGSNKCDTRSLQTINIIIQMLYCIMQPKPYPNYTIVTHLMMLTFSC